MSNAVDHPIHYGGKDDPYEAIKVIEALSLRMHDHAQYEIRVYAEAMQDLIKDVVPVYLAAFDEGRK